MMDPEKAMLGTGWSFPPSFSRLNYSVEMVSAEEDIRQSLHILFATAMGERIMLPLYGTDLQKKVFRAATTTLMTQLAASVEKAVLFWEPRINVDDVFVQPDPSIDGLVSITVSYTIRQTNARNNMVFPFYLKEATIPVETP
ncbi:MAG TPA: GPW/gp25 family protein [Candidatus Angelobacter sp.]